MTTGTITIKIDEDNVSYESDFGVEQVIAWMEILKIMIVSGSLTQQVEETV